MELRRVVTGHDAEGRGTVVSDGPVGPTAFSGSGNLFHQLWGADDAVVLADVGPEPAFDSPLAPVGGFRAGVFTLAPGDGAGGPGMHGTDSVDIDLVLDGEVVLTVEDGTEVVLQAGDVVVLNGTTHAWANRGATPARLAVFTVGARRQT